MLVLRLLRVFSVLAVLLGLALPVEATWSIVAVNARTGEVGAASVTCLANFDLRRAAPVIERRETENMRRYKRDLAIVVALNEALVAKGCPPIDIKSQIKDDARLMGVSLRKLK